MIYIYNHDIVHDLIGKYCIDEILIHGGPRKYGPYTYEKYTGTIAGDRIYYRLLIISK